MNEVSIRLAEHLPAPEITVVEEGGARRTHYVDERDLLGVLRSAMEERVSFGQRYFPKTLLGGDMQHASIWWRPAAPQMVTVEQEDGRQQMLTVPLPGLVLGIGKAGLRLVAVKGLNRPEAESPVCLAPFPNIGSGSVCLGSGERVKPEMLLQPELAWAALWGSSFTGHSISGRSRKYPYDVRELLFSLEGRDTFPEEDLVPMEVTLEEFVHGE